MNTTVHTAKSNPEENPHYRVTALYKFVTLPKPAIYRDGLLEVCKANKVMGTILLAQEGINGTIAGSKDGIEAVLTWLQKHEPFAELDYKDSWAHDAPFYRMKVRIKREIVTLGVDGLDPSKQAGTYVKPEDWNDLIAQDDVIVVDTRNNYEVAIGTFKGAENPETTSFRELPQWVEDKLQAKPDTKIAMFCTGGIRCEKSTALLRTHGYDNVFHLKGGILKYLEHVPEEQSLWEGECFVFDQRVSVKHGLEPGDYDMCHGCRMPIREEDKTHPNFAEGISCHHCHDRMSDSQRARYTERQKQIELAKARNENHIAADVQAAKQIKRVEKEEQRERSRKS